MARVHKVEVSKPSFLEAIVYSARHAGSFPENLANKVRRGDLVTLYINVPSLYQAIVNDAHNQEPTKAQVYSQKAHDMLDDWITGKLTAPPYSPYSDQLDPTGRGVIWLGPLQQAMTVARIHYRNENSEQSKTPHEPHMKPVAPDVPKMQNKRGEWVLAIPEPLNGFRKLCTCGAGFWRMKSYREHYALVHILEGNEPL